jgi:hypothetical protein
MTTFTHTMGILQDRKDIAELIGKIIMDKIYSIQEDEDWGRLTFENDQGEFNPDDAYYVRDLWVDVADEYLGECMRYAKELGENRSFTVSTAITDTNGNSQTRLMRIKLPHPKSKMAKMNIEFMRKITTEQLLKVLPTLPDYNNERRAWVYDNKHKVAGETL